ncbi:50S ribosomal protein L35 [Patescibacteria group bacterium]|nr:50S ribosomal protein L35 [Patescibacteria group bacterium]
MPNKLKTNKSAAKRIKITKTGKAIKRKAGQCHFNARESGKITMNKRRDVLLSKVSAKQVKQQLPYA